MASKPSTVGWIVEQAAGAGAVSARRMFGEYALYCDGKLVALVCDDRLFLKPTPAGRALLGQEAEEVPPYPGAKPCLVVPGERWDGGGVDGRARADDGGRAPAPEAETRRQGRAGSLIAARSSVTLGSTGRSRSSPSRRAASG